MDTTVTIVIPAYNEAQSLPAVLPGLLEQSQRLGWQIIVVNDGSKDTTRQELEKFVGCSWLHVFHHKVNRGYGGALKTGILHAETPYLVTMDADGQHRFEDIHRLLVMMLKTDADLVIGSRNSTNRKNLYREMGKSLIRGVTRLLMPLPIHDLNSGFKLYRTPVVKQYVHLCPDSMAFSDIITLIFISQRHLVVEQPIEIYDRVAGKSTINTRTAFETLYEILNIIMLFNPMHIFLPISFLCILFGVVWGIPIVMMGRGVSVGSMLAVVTGIIFLFLGLVAEQLSLIRKGKVILPEVDLAIECSDDELEA